MLHPDVTLMSPGEFTGCWLDESYEGCWTLAGRVIHRGSRDAVRSQATPLLTIRCRRACERRSRPPCGGWEDQPGGVGAQSRCWRGGHDASACRLARPHLTSSPRILAAHHRQLIGCSSKLLVSRLTYRVPVHTPSGEAIYPTGSEFRQLHRARDAAPPQQGRGSLRGVPEPPTQEAAS